MLFTKVKGNSFTLFCLRCISIVVLLCFTITQSGYAALPSSTSEKLATSDQRPAANLDSFVTMSDYYSPNKSVSSKALINDPKQKAVIYLEDAHGNLSAQKNIADAIDAVSNKVGIKLPWIALEGTEAGEIDHKILTAFPDKSTKEIVAHYLFEKGDLDSADYYAASYNSDARLFGVDNGEMAEENRQAYRNYQLISGEVSAALDHMRNTADFLKKRIYYGDLVKLDKSVEKFERIPNHLLQHLKVLEGLTKKNSVDIISYPNITNLIELKTLESKITESGLEREWEQFQDTGHKTQDTRKSSVNERILEIWGADKAAFNEYPHLKNRARFLELSDQLEGVPVFEEIKALTSALWERLLDYREAQDAFKIDQAVKFYEKLFNFELLPEEYSDYLNDKLAYSIDSLKEQIADYNFLLRPKEIRPSEKQFELLKTAFESPLLFYELAEKRNDPLVNNLVNLIKRNPNKKTFLIAGGFHRGGITNLLRKKKIPYVVLSPKITDTKGTNNYWKQLGGHKSNLEFNLANISAVKLRDKFTEPAFRKEVQFLLAGILLSKGELTQKSSDKILKGYRDKLADYDQRFLDQLLENLKIRGDGWASAEFNNNEFILRIAKEDEMQLQPPFNLEDFRKLETGTIGGLTITLYQNMSVRTMPVPVKATRINDFGLSDEVLLPVETSAVKVVKLKGTDKDSLDRFSEKLMNEIAAATAGIELNINPNMLKQFFNHIYKIRLKNNPNLPALFFEKFRNRTVKIDFDNFNYLFSLNQKDPKNLVLQIDLPSLRAFEKQTGEGVVPFLPEILIATAVFSHYLFGHFIGINNESDLEISNAEFFMTFLNSLEGSKQYKDLPFWKSFLSVFNKLIDQGEDKQGGSTLAKRLRSLYGKKSQVRRAESTRRPPAVAAKQLIKGTVIKGQYKIIEQLGRGAFGKVYKALDQNLKKVVAIKELQPNRMTTDDKARFGRETEIMGLIDSPRLVQIFARIEPTAEFPNEYIVESFIPGKPLEEWIPKIGQPRTPEHLTDQELILVMIEILKALNDMHDFVYKDPETKKEEHMPFMHRDVKPENVMVDYNRETGELTVNLVDLGLAKQVGTYGFGESGQLNQANITAQGVVMGTANYMAPEIIAGHTKGLTTAVDMYSAGIMLYQMFTNRIAVNPTNDQMPVHTLLLRHANSTYKPPEIYNKTIDADLSYIILKSIALAFPNHPPTYEILKEQIDPRTKKRLVRYNDASEMLMALQNYYAVKYEGAKPSAKARLGKRLADLEAKKEKQAARKKTVGWVIAVVGIIVLGGFITYWLRSGKTPDQAVDRPDNGKTPAAVPPGKKEETTKTPEEKAREEEQRKIALSLADASTRAKALDVIYRSIISRLGTIRKALNTMLADVNNANANLDNLPVVQNMEAKVKKSKKDSIDPNIKFIKADITQYRNKLSEFRALVNKIKENKNISSEQIEELKPLLTKLADIDFKIIVLFKLLEGVEGGRAPPELADKVILALAAYQKEAAQRVADAVAALTAAKDPTRRNLILADAQIQKVKNIVQQLPQATTGFSPVDKLINDITESKKALDQKTQELMKVYSDLSSEITRLSKKKKPTDEDLKKLEDMEKKAPVLLEEVQKLQTAFDNVQARFDAEIKPIVSQLLVIDQAVATVSKLAKEDPKIKDKAGEMDTEASKAQALRTALEERKKNFQKALAEARAAIDLAKLQIVAYSGKLAYTRVDAAKSKVYQLKNDRTKSREERVAANKVYTDVQKLLNTFKKAVIYDLPARPALLVQISALSKRIAKDGLNPANQQALQVLMKKVFETEKEKYSDQAFLESAKKLFKSINLNLNIKEPGVLWVMNDKTIKNTFVKDSGNPTGATLIKRGDYYRFPHKESGKSWLHFDIPAEIKPDINMTAEIEVEFPNPGFITSFFIGLYSVAEKQPTYIHISQLTNTIRVGKKQGIHSFVLMDRNYGEKIIDFDFQKKNKIKIIIKFNPQKNIFEIYLEKVNKPIYKFSLFKNKPNPYTFMILNTVGFVDQPEKVTGFNMVIKGQSLGVEIPERANSILELANDENKKAIILIPYSKSIINTLFSNKMKYMPINQSKIVFTCMGANIKEAKMKLNKYKTIYDIDLISTDKSLEELSEHDVNTILARVMKKNSEIGINYGNPVLLSFKQYSVGRVSKDSFSKDVAGIFRMRADFDNFLQKDYYKYAYLIAAAALSKELKLGNGFVLNDDGSISLIEELIDNFTLRIQEISQLARAA